MREADRQAEGPAVALAREVEDALAGEMGDLVVIFELVGHLRHAGFGDGGEVVVPPVDALAGLRPVRRPAEIGRVDVGGQPLLEAVQLVRPDEMHLSA